MCYYYLLPFCSIFLPRKHLKIFFFCYFFWRNPIIKTLFYRNNMVQLISTIYTAQRSRIIVRINFFFVCIINFLCEVINFSSIFLIRWSVWIPAWISFANNSHRITNQIIFLKYFARIFQMTHFTNMIIAIRNVFVLIYRYRKTLIAYRNYFILASGI